MKKFIGITGTWITAIVLTICSYWVGLGICLWLGYGKINAIHEYNCWNGAVVVGIVVFSVAIAITIALIMEDEWRDDF